MRKTVTADGALIALDSVLRAARTFASTTAASVAQIGDAVTLPELRVLALASTRPTLNNTDVAVALDVHLSDASGTCDRLVKAGLLSRRQSPADRRVVDLSLTRDGDKLLVAVRAHRQAAFSRILRRMPVEDQLALARALDAFTDLADEHIERQHTQL